MFLVICHPYLNFSAHKFYKQYISQIGPGGMRAPCVLACDMRSLAIVITNFSSFSLSFYLRLLLLTHFGDSPMCEIIVYQIFWHN